MSEVEKGKRKKAAKEHDERMPLKLGWREIFLIDYLTTIANAHLKTASEQIHFAEALQNELASNADLKMKIKAQPHMAKKVISSLPCGHKVVREFIKEVLRK